MIDLDLSKLKQLIETLAEGEVSEFEYEDEKVRVRIGRGGQVVAVHPPGCTGSTPGRRRCPRRRWGLPAR